ncbi:MAG: hypothetical protein JO132_01850 [Streptosporangiaceae bacterium]|nr:hypothetical protein [Streptosporangiaceae bacterium]
MPDTSDMRPADGAQAEKRPRDHEPQLVSRVGALEIDWPRSLGFFGGVAVAVGAGLIDPPLGLFIVAVPFLKMLDLPRLPGQFRFAAQVFEGVAKPVGGDSQGTVRLVTGKGASDEPVQQGG